MIRRTLAVSLLALAFPVVFGQTVDELVQKNVEASGGVAALESKNSVRMTGVLKTQGMEMPITVLRKRPHFSRTEVTFQGMSMIDAYDGTGRWKIIPFSGSNEPGKASPGETADMKQQSDFDPQLLDYKAKGRSIELVGKEPVEGKEAYKLKLTLETGQVQEIYLDPATFYVIKQAGRVQTPQGEQPIETVLSDHQTTEGVTIPHSIHTRVGATDIEILIQKVEWNVDLADSLFKMPAKGN